MTTEKTEDEIKFEKFKALSINVALSVIEKSFPTAMTSAFMMSKNQSMPEEYNIFDEEQRKLIVNSVLQGQLVPVDKIISTGYEIKLFETHQFNVAAVVHIANMVRDIYKEFLYYKAVNENRLQLLNEAKNPIIG